MNLRYTKITSWEDSEDELRAIRHDVFVTEQQCPPEGEWDEFDASAEHFLVKDSENRTYATARLLRNQDSSQKAKIGRFAVYPAYRRQGIGRQLVKFVIGFARSQGILELELSAQAYIQGLYSEFGFQKEGDVYNEVGIPHVKMRLVLGQKKQRIAAVTGQDERVYRFSDQNSYLNHLLSLLTQARHKALILTQDLEKRTLDHPQILDALSSLARNSRSSYIRIVVQDPKPAIYESNQLLSLSRRLTSSIEIRQLNPNIEFPENVFVLTDEHGVILRHNHQSWEGFCCYSDAGTVKRLTESFTRLLSYSQPSPELTRFSL